MLPFAGLPPKYPQGLGWLRASQEPGTKARSPTWVPGTQILDLSLLLPTPQHQVTDEQHAGSRAELRETSQALSRPSWRFQAPRLNHELKCLSHIDDASNDAGIDWWKRKLRN